MYESWSLRRRRRRRCLSIADTLNISLLVYSEVMFDTLMTMVIVGLVHNEHKNIVSVRDNAGNMNERKYY